MSTARWKSWTAATKREQEAAAAKAASAQAEAVAAAREQAAREASAATQQLITAAARESERAAAEAQAQAVAAARAEARAEAGREASATTQQLLAAQEEREAALAGPRAKVEALSQMLRDQQDELRDAYRFSAACKLLVAVGRRTALSLSHSLLQWRQACIMSGADAQFAAASDERSSLQKQLLANDLGKRYTAPASCA